MLTGRREALPACLLKELSEGLGSGMSHTEKAHFLGMFLDILGILVQPCNWILTKFCPLILLKPNAAEITISDSLLLPCAQIFT